MPGLISETSFEMIKVKELHPTFVAEIVGINFQDTSKEQLGEIKAALAKYGACVFRSTGLDDVTHIEFSKRFGALDDLRKFVNKNGRTKLRYGHWELFDAGNIDENGEIVHPDSERAHFIKGNTLFHVDSSFNPRRSSYSLLRAFELPPPGNGGDTEFADSRQAFEDLAEDLKKELLEKDYVAVHSIWHSRKSGSPEYFKDLDISTMPMAKHKLVQRHEPSGRMNLYIAAHAHNIEGLEPEKSKELLGRLLRHATQKKYVIAVPWFNPSDLVIWDNTCVLHRAGEFAGGYKRDLRRTTVHDDSPTAWGLNEKLAA